MSRTSIQILGEPSMITRATERPGRWKILALCLLHGLALSLSVRALDLFSFENTPGRLPKEVVPLDYEIAIVPDAKALTITGTESVRLDFRKATETIQFNSLNEKLSNVTLDGEPVKSVVSEDKTEL